LSSVLGAGQEAQSRRSRKDTSIRKPGVKQFDVKQFDVKQCDVKQSDVKRPDIKQSDVKQFDAKLTAEGIQDVLEQMSMYLNIKASKLQVDLVAIASTKNLDKSSTPSHPVSEVEFLHLKHEDTAYNYMYNAIEHARKKRE
jgi:hypothetical protein